MPTETPTQLQSQQLTQIHPQWRNEFIRFVETGEASEDFLNYVDQDQNAQEAVEMAFKTQANAFENLAQELKGTRPEARTAALELEPVERVSAKVAEAVKHVSKLPPQKKQEALDQITSKLKISMDSAELESARSVGNTLANL